LIASLLVMLFLLPSANVTLVANASPFARSIQISARPGQPPIAVRTQNEEQTASTSFPATGAAVSQSRAARGMVEYSDSCPNGFRLLAGQQLIARNGSVFVQQAETDIGPGEAVTVPVYASLPGMAGNVGAGQVTGIANLGPLASCLSVTNPQPMSGGSDGQKDTMISLSDVEQARSMLERQLQQKITQDLERQGQSGEKLSEPISFQSSGFSTDHQADERVKSFTATITVQGVGAFYRTDDVNKAFAAELARFVPEGQRLTADSVKVNYQVASSVGGHLTFNGRASGYVAPYIDLDQIKRGLPGHSVGSAKSHLEGLPVQAVLIRQYPLPLPWLPFISSRINLRYQVQEGGSGAPG
jgi:hypothetical protein